MSHPFGPESHLVGEFPTPASEPGTRQKLFKYIPEFAGKTAAHLTIIRNRYRFHLQGVKNFRKM